MVQPKKTQPHRLVSRYHREARATPNRDTSSHLSSRPYDRRVELPRILPLWPHELADESLEGRRNIVCKLRRALRAERRRGVAGHWTYDLARHAELLRIYRLELASSTCPTRTGIETNRRAEPDAVERGQLIPFTHFDLGRFQPERE